MFRVLYRLILALALTAAVAVVAFRIAAWNRETLPAEALFLSQSRMIETVHGDLHALDAGEGPALLLIHGSVGWAGLWQDTLREMTGAGYRVIALDLPPMGLSERGAGFDYSRQAQALRILAVVEALEIRPVIVAHSFGAGAAAEAMIAAPEAFAGGVIVAGAIGLGQDGTGQSLPMILQPRVIREAALASTVTNPYVNRFLLGSFVHRRESITDSLVGVLDYPFRRSGTTGALADWLPDLLLPPRGAASTDPARFAALDLPVALIWGREDTTTPPDQALALQAALGDAPLFWLDAVGHIPQIEAPEEFHRALKAALAGIEEG